MNKKSALMLVLITVALLCAVPVLATDTTDNATVSTYSENLIIGPVTGGYASEGVPDAEGIYDPSNYEHNLAAKIDADSSNWYQYNGSMDFTVLDSYTFDLVKGNGLNKVGEYTITYNGDSGFTITFSDWIEAVGANLSISNIIQFFQDRNADDFDGTCIWTTAPDQQQFCFSGASFTFDAPWIKDLTKVIIYMHLDCLKVCDATYSITYDPNGGDFGDSDEPAVIENLSAGTYTLDLNVTHGIFNDRTVLFVGWSLTPYSIFSWDNAKYADTVTSVTITDESVTVYAVWKYAMQTGLGEFFPGQHLYTYNGINFYVMIPDRWPDAQCGLIIDMHGYTMTPQDEDDGTNMRELGNIYGYVVVNPEGPGRTVLPEVMDAPTMEMVLLLVDIMGLDADRIHMTGFSMGGSMTWRIIRDYSDILASAAPAASGANGAWHSVFSEGNVPPIQIPLLYIHGTKDTVVLYSNGLIQIDRVIAAWGMTGGLIGGDDTYRHYLYTNEYGTVFEYYLHDYSTNAPFGAGTAGGHCFPGGKAIYDPDVQTPTTPFGAQDDNVSFNWGEEVIRFFIEHPKIHADDVSIDQSDVFLGIGDTLQMTATITPWNAADKRVSWSSSDTNVATVDENGLVTAVGIGDATIAAAANDGGYEAYCNISVTMFGEITPGQHVYTYEGINFYVMIPDQWPYVQCGLIVDMHGYTMTPQDEDDGTNMRELGNIYGYVVVNPEGPNKTVLPEVMDAPTAEMVLLLVDVLGLDADRVHMTGFSMGGWMTWRIIRDYPDIFASAAPASAGASARACSFTGDDVPPIQIPILYTHGTLDSIVSYSSGITQINAVLTAWDMTGGLIGGDDTYRHYLYTNDYGTVFEYYEHDYYTDAPFAAFGGRPAGGHCFPGGTAIYDPDNPAPTTPFGAQGDVSFNWGEEVIRFFIEHPKIHAEDVNIDQNDTYQKVGDTLQLTATISPWNAADKRVTWSSSNTNVATVDENGLVTILDYGEVTIAVTTNDGGYEAYCNISVNELGGEISPGLHVYSYGGMNFFVMIPDQWPDEECGLIVDIHGATMTPQDEDDGTNMRELGNMYGYVVVDPEGPNRMVYPDTVDVPTIEMVLLLVDVLGLDADRVHVTGFSMGAWMTWRFIRDYPEIFASAAPASCTANGSLTCTFTGDDVPPIQIPILYMHGTKDTVATYSTNGAIQRDRIVALWDMDGGLIGGDDTFRHYLYTNDYGTVFEYIEHDYSTNAPFGAGIAGGHCFPGGKAIYDPENPAPTTPFGAQDDVSFNWGEEVIRFFMEHPKIHVDSVEIDQSYITPEVGDTIQLTATTSPWNAADKRVTWSSSNTDVATVDGNGIVTILDYGEAIIAVTTNDGGYEVYCYIYVNEPEDEFSPGTHIFTMNGINFYVTIPEQWPEVQCGLIVDIHGATMTPQDEDDGTNMRELGNMYGYVVVNPEGPNRMPTAVIDKPTIDMVLYLIDVMDLDPDRIHVTGFSMGGMMTWRMIRDYPDIFASAAPASSAANNSLTCTFTGNDIPPIQIPILFMYGTRDVWDINTNGRVQRDSVLAAWDLTGGLIGGDDTYRHYLYTNDYGTVFEYLEHDYYTNAPFPGAPGGIAGGHCFPGGKAVYDPDNPITSPTQFGAQDDVSFNWGEEVIRFFIEHPKIHAEDVNIDQRDVILEIGETLQLTATISPWNAADKRVTWTSSNEYVATVDENGLLSAVGTGEVTITVTTNDGGYRAYSAIFVQDPFERVTGITLDKSTMTLPLYGTGTITASIFPENANDKRITWTSSDESVVIVNAAGGVIGIRIGTATITAATNDGGFTAECIVTVAVPVTSVSISKDSMVLIEGSTGTLEVTLLPGNATDKSVAWSSDDESVATVDANGWVTAVGAGTATITATTNDGGFVVSCTVTVIAAFVHVTGVTLDKDVLVIAVGDSEMLTATVLQENATDKSVTWSSTDGSVVTVDQDGTVTGVGIGTAAVYIRTIDGNYVALCIVTVTGGSQP